MSTKQLKNKIIKQEGPLSKPEDENKPGFNEVDKAKEQYQKSKAKTEKSEQKEDKPQKEDKSKNTTAESKPTTGNDNNSSFVQMLKNSGWKKTQNKSGKQRLQKVIKDYIIILTGDDISDLSFQSRSYSSKFTEFIANIICERTEAIDVTLIVLSKATEGKKSKVLKQFDLTLSLNITEKAFNKKIKQCLQRISKVSKVEVAAAQRNKNTVDVKAEEKNQAKPLSKDKMIDSILDRLTDEQFDILAKRYKILNMD